MSAGKWKHINLFPDEVIHLQRELANHPKLMKLLRENHRADSWETKLAEIAKYCDVVLHGDYLEEDLVKICGILEKKLIERREDNRGMLIIV
jgi:hypothetical protein